MTPPVIASVLFTSGKFGIHKAPLPYPSVFFTNRQAIADEAACKGWMPCILPISQSDCVEENSLSSKTVKFLDVLESDAFQALNLPIDGGLLYVDHKFMIRRRHVRQIVRAAGDKAILIRANPRGKTSIWQEIEDASKQERYARVMPETIAFLEERLANGARADVRIANTGLIYYADVPTARPLARAVLGSCMDLCQPECQIFWALHAQEIEDKIRLIDWRHPAVANIRWKDPLGAEKFPDGRPGKLIRIRNRILDRLLP